MNRLFAMSLCGAALLLPGLAGAQTQTYVASSWSSSFVQLPIPGEDRVHVNIRPSSPRTETEVQLPFGFEFYGTTHHRLSVGVNGHVTFGTSATSNANQAIPDPAAPNNLIAVWWDQITCDGSSSIRHQTLGAIPNRQFVIEWRGCRHPSISGSNFEAQLWLGESGRIQMHYGAINGTGWTATMGLEGPTGTDGTVPAGSTCGNACDASDFPTGRVVNYVASQDPDLVAEVMLGGLAVDGDRLSIDVDLRVNNFGATAADDVSWNYYLSRMASLDLNQAIPIGATDALAPLAPFSTTEWQETLEAQVQPGLYWLCVLLDPDDLVEEYDERNNGSCTAEPFAFGVDLLGSIGVPSSGTVDSFVTLPVVMTNRGSHDAATFTWRIFLSSNNTLDGNDELMAQGTLSLASGETFPGPIRAIVPATTTLNLAYAILVIDADNTTGDIVRSNNTVVSSSTMSIQRADLRVDAATINFPEGCYFDRPVEVSWRVCNGGSGVAKGFVNGLLISANDAIAVSDPAIFTTPGSCSSDEACAEGSMCVAGTCRTVCETTDECSNGLVCDIDRDEPEISTCQMQLAPSACRDFPATTMMLPRVDVAGNDIAEGTYWFGVGTDLAGRLPESNETNNTRAAGGEQLCRIPSPDFAVEMVEPPARMAAGETAVVSRTIVNLGNRSGVVRYRYVLTTNDIVSLHDVPLSLVGASRDGWVEIDLGGSDTRTDLVHIPSTIAPGQYFLGLVIDPLEELHELDKENNTGVSTRTVRVDASSLRIATASLADATVGGYYVRQLIAYGGSATYHWSSSELPPGMTLTDAGLLSGTPTDDGTFAFRVRVQSGDISTETMLALRVSRPMGPLAISTTELPPGAVGHPYTARIAVVGGEPPYVCSRATGDLPLGLRYEDNGCTIVGTPLQRTAVPVSHEVAVRDARQNTTRRTFTISVSSADAVVMDKFRLDDALAGEDYSTGCVNAHGGDAPYEWSVDTASVPAELAVVNNPNNRVCFHGVPTQCGNFRIPVSVKDSQGQSDSRTLSLTVICEQIRLLTRSVEPVKRGDEVSVQLEANGGEGLQFRVLGGRLPAGLTLSTSGLLSGTIAGDAPFGTYNLVIEMSDAVGGHGLAPLAITIEAEPVSDSERFEKKTKPGCSSASDGATGSLPFAAALLGLFVVGLRRRLGEVAPAPVRVVGDEGGENSES